MTHMTQDGDKTVSKSLYLNENVNDTVRTWKMKMLKLPGRV